MKEKKKLKGTKAEIRAYKERIRRIATVVIVAVLVVIAATVSGFLIYSYLKPSSQNIGSAQPKAAIVDQLSTAPTGGPNQTFIQTATSILQTANYTVDYYSGEKVDVEFYRNLPTHGYSLIVLRVHSTFGGPDNKSVILFTSERFNQFKYLLESNLEVVAYSTEEVNRSLYFGIGPSFVQNNMNGMFNKTIIIMMGCDGLMYTPMAEAFINKGAKVYIGWSGPVSVFHTDQATTHLLQHLITEKQTIEQAVTETMLEVGPDPTDESILLYRLEES